jgi:acylphosphatase
MLLFFTFENLMPTVFIRVTGKVQGVYFRASARETAQQLQLTGWIKNTREGAVEATVSGSSDAIAQFEAWCRKGPSGARVTQVLTESMPDQQFEKFEVRR